MLENTSSTIVDISRCLGNVTSPLVRVSLCHHLSGVHLFLGTSRLIVMDLFLVVLTKVELVVFFMTTRVTPSFTLENR